MKAIDLYKTGLIMSGGDGDEEFLITKDNPADELFFINRALSDLRLTPAYNVGDEIEGSAAALDAACCGIAYYLALRAADRERVKFLCDMYNAKRASALSEISRIKCGAFYRN